MSVSPAIELCGVTKDFVIGLRGVRLRAVSNLNLTVNAGEIFGLLGPNGSGKSTTIKIVLGFLHPTAGSCTLFGVPSGRPEARLAVGYLPEAPDFYRYLTGHELVSFYGQLCGLRGKELSAGVAGAIEAVGMSHAAKRRVGTYSKGMLQRIGLAQAIVHNPKLLILDEPTAGVDAVAAEEMRALLLELKAQGKTIVLTSHLLAQVEDLCDRVAILDRGRLLVEGRVSDLTHRTSAPDLSIDLLGPAEREELDRWLAVRGYSPSRAGNQRVRFDHIFREQLSAEREGRNSG